MKSGNVVQLSEDCLRAIAAIRKREEDCYLAFSLAIAEMKQARDQMIAVIREHHPELKDHDFTIRHTTGDVLANWPVDWNQHE